MIQRKDYMAGTARQIIAENTPHKPYQPKTGEACGCKRGAQRDNCPNCEGTGMLIDFRAIREKGTP